MSAKPDSETISAQVAALESLSREELVAEWKKLNKRPPPSNISRSLLLRAVAYQVQENAYGGLKKSVREQLRRIASSPNGMAAQTTQVNPGNRLLREWHGVTHEVTIEENGVRYRGETYGSLSEVAKNITGVKWSGPAFFGLRKRSK